MNGPPQYDRNRGNHYSEGDYGKEKQWRSWLVPTIVVANIVMFVVSMYVNDCPSHHLGYFRDKCAASSLGRFSFEPPNSNPLYGPSSATLDKMGALNRNKIVYNHQKWRLVSCMWLHAGLVHLAANMLSLIFIGIRLEQQFGFVRVGIIYLLSGFGGSVLSSLFLKNGISVGASGALFGLLGAMLSELITNWSMYSNKVGALFTLLVIIVINLLLGILPHVDNFAHIGGFISGFLLGFVFLVRPHYGVIRNPNLSGPSMMRSKHKAYQYVFWVVAALLYIAGLTAELVLLFKGKDLNEKCKWCHYLTCVPTSKWKCD